MTPEQEHDIMFYSDNAQQARILSKYKKISLGFGISTLILSATTGFMVYLNYMNNCFDYDLSFSV